MRLQIQFKKIVITIFFSCQLIFFPLTKATSQSLSLIDAGLYDYARREQLKGKIDSTISFHLKPIRIEAFDSTVSRYAKSTLFKDDVKGLEVSLLPTQFNFEYNSKYPYGSNNGSMVRSRGGQTLFSAGIFLRAGPIAIQMKPEWVYTQNQVYEGFPDSHPNDIWSKKYDQGWNRIDLPESYGEDPSSKFLPGQSSVRLNYKLASIGISSENLWWGPGQHHGLVMTNNPRGFYHFTLNTSSPIKTPIGSLEGQIIAGRLDNSDIDPPVPTRRIGKSNPWAWRKVDDWRYINGITFSYQPKWVPGLFLGGSRVIQNYADSIKSTGKYFPVLDNLFRKNDLKTKDGSKDQILSLYARWLWLSTKSEIYFEFGKADASWNLRDALLSPEHSRSYLVGLSKLIALADHNQFIKIGFETTHLELSKTGTLRDEPKWYQNGKNRHGYTHYGEILGAGIQPGSNIQNIEVSWINGLKKIGVQFERLANDNDFYFKAFDFADTQKDGNWIDTSIGILCVWNWKHLMLDAQSQWIKSRNYQWTYDQERSNFHFSLKSTYTF